VALKATMGGSYRTTQRLKERKKERKQRSLQFRKKRKVLLVKDALRRQGLDQALSKITYPQ
jgi:hypothetical protein